MGYEMVALRQVISIEKIVTVHYFEYSANFSFAGETHDFWEFLYVDRGRALITAGENSFYLEKDQMVFHKPMEFHNVQSMGATPNLVVIAFACDSPMMYFFAEKVLKMDPALRLYLQRIVQEAKMAYESDLSDPMLNKLVRRQEQEWGCEQMLKNYLEQFLIELYRRQLKSKGLKRDDRLLDKLAPGFIRYENNQLFSLIVDYMERSIGKQLKLEDICKDNMISRSALQKLFREMTGAGVISFFNRMKIEYAKILIRQKTMNFTQISQVLGYSSIHYLSRQFKEITAMTLSEYANSVL